MKRSPVIARREMASYFYSPIAYVVLALFLFISGVLFFDDFQRDSDDNPLASVHKNSDAKRLDKHSRRFCFANAFGFNRLPKYG